MRITNIITRPYTPSYNRQTSPVLSTIQPGYSELGRDSVSFGNISISASKLKELAAHGLPCIYCNHIMMQSNTVDRLIQEGAFKGSIREFLKKTFFCKKYLQPPELKFYEEIEKIRKTNPDYTLPQVIQKLYTDARKNLRRTQKPYFDKINTLGAQLPDEYRQKFYDFMILTGKKLYDTPILQEFSGKEFTYKLFKMLSSVNDRETIKRIIKIAENLTHPAFKNPDMPLSKKIIEKIYNINEIKAKLTKKIDLYLKYMILPKELIQLDIIKHIKAEAAKLKRKDIINLCDDAYKMINREPVRVPFRNKTFIYDMEELLQNLPNKDLHDKIIKIAKQLPKSSDSISAFILKHEKADGNTIGRSLFDPSIASIEHIKPKSLGGPSDINNYALADKKHNSDRSSIPMSEYIKNFPSENIQKYADKIIELEQKDLIPYDDVIGMFDSIERQSGVKINREGLVFHDSEYYNNLTRKMSIAKELSAAQKADNIDAPKKHSHRHKKKSKQM